MIYTLKTKFSFNMYLIFSRKQDEENVLCSINKTMKMHFCSFALLHGLHPKHLSGQSK